MYTVYTNLYIARDRHPNVIVRNKVLSVLILFYKLEKYYSAKEINGQQGKKTSMKILIFFFKYSHFLLYIFTSY